MTGLSGAQQDVEGGMSHAEVTERTLLKFMMLITERLSVKASGNVLIG